MQKLDPKAVWLFFLSSITGFIFLVPILIYIVSIFSNVIGTAVNEGVTTSLFDPATFVIWALVTIVVILALSYFWATLSYNNYKYELREDGFRKEHGVIWKKYVTIPYERIQNVDIYRGLLARILGLSDLNIQTAGMSSVAGSYGGGAEGRLPGVSPQVAEQLRDELVKRAKGTKQGV